MSIGHCGCNDAIHRTHPTPSFVGRDRCVAAPRWTSTWRACARSSNDTARIWKPFEPSAAASRSRTGDVGTSIARWRDGGHLYDSTIALSSSIDGVLIVHLDVLRTLPRLAATVERGGRQWCPSSSAEAKTRLRLQSALAMREQCDPVVAGAGRSRC